MRLSGQLHHPIALAGLLVALGACGQTTFNIPPLTPPPRTRFTISGSTSGVANAGIWISVMPGEASTAVTTIDTSGRYSFTDLANGDYRLTPLSYGYLFTPPSRSVSLAGADLPAQDFAAALAPRYTVGGSIAMTGSLHVLLYEAPTGLDFAFGSGTWSYSVIDGTYTLQPRAMGYVFSPVSRVVVVSGADVPDVAFTAIAAASSSTVAAKVTGTIIDASTFTLSQGGTTVGVALSRGSDVSFPGLLDGSYVVTPSDAHYTFSPTSQAVTVSGGNPTPLLLFVATPL